MARARRTAFEDDFRDAARQQFGYRFFFVLCAGEKVELVAGGQEDVGVRQGLLQGVMQAGGVEQFAAQIGVKRYAAAARFDGVQGVEGKIAHAGGGPGRCP